VRQAQERECGASHEKNRANSCSFCGKTEAAQNTNGLLYHPVTALIFLLAVIASILWVTEYTMCFQTFVLTGIDDKSIPA